MFVIFRYCLHIQFLTGNSEDDSLLTNSAAKLRFDPQPEPTARPVLIRPLLRPNVIDRPLPPTPMISQSTAAPSSASFRLVRPSSNSQFSNN